MSKLLSIYNASLGLPGQLLLRLLKVLKDPDVDLLDEKGFADQALIPIFGAMDDDPQHAFGTDITGEDNQLGGFALEVALDPLTYMTGMATAGAKGASALARTGQQASKVGKSARFGKKWKMMETAAKEGRATVGDALRLIDDRMASGTLASGERKSLVASREALEPLKDQVIKDVLAEAGKRELAIGVPGLVKFGVVKTLKTEHDSWFKLIGNKSSRAAKGMAMVTGRGLSLIPGMKGVVDSTEKTLTAFSTGFSNQAKAKIRLETKTNAESAFGLDEAAKILNNDDTAFQLRVNERVANDELGRTIGDHFDQRLEAVGGTPDDMFMLLRNGSFEEVENLIPSHLLDKKLGQRQTVRDRLRRIGNQKSEKVARKMTDTLRKHLQEVGGATPDQSRAFLRSFGIPLGGKSVDEVHNEAQSLLKRLTGKKDPSMVTSGAELDDVYNQFGHKIDSARTAVLKAETKPVPIEEVGLGSFKGLTKKAFESGAALRKTLRMMFKSDITVEGFEEFERAYRNASAGTSELAQAVGREMFGQLKVIADANPGIDVKQIERTFLNLFEGSFGHGEVEDWFKYLGAGGERSKGAAQSMRNFLTRASTAIPVFAKLAKEFGVEGAADIERVMGKEEARRVVHGERAVERAFKDMDANSGIVGPSPNARKASGGQFEGEYLGHLADEELSALRVELKERGTRAMSTEDMLNHIEDNPVLGRFKDFYGLSAKETAAVIKRARKTGKDFHLPGLRLSPDEMEDFRSLAAQVTDKDLAIMEGKGTSFKVTNLIDEDVALANDWDAVEQLIGHRERNTASQLAKPETLRVAQEGIVGPRAVRAQGLRDEAGKFGSSELVSRAFYRLAAMNEDLVRYVDEIEKAAEVGRKPNIPQEFMDEFIGTAQELNLAQEQMLIEALGPEAEKLLTALRDVQKKTTMQAAQLGLLDHGGAPLGYVGRMMSNTNREALKKLGTQVNRELSGTGKHGDALKREFDEMTIEELNSEYARLRESDNPPLYAKMKKIMEEEDMVLEKLESSPFNIFVNKLGKMGAKRTAADFVNDALRGGVDDQVLSGRVIGYVDDAGRGRILDRKALEATRMEGTAIELDVKHRERMRNATGLVIEDMDGNQRFIKGDAMDFGVTLTPYGRRGATVGDAATVHAMEKGTHTPITGALTSDELPEYLDQWVAFGNDAVVSSVHSLVNAQFKHSNDFLRGFDSVNNLMRKFQTIFRPAFHVANLSSGVFQTLALGTSVRHTVMGHYDAARILFGSDKSWLKHYDSASAMMGEERIIRKGILARFGGAAEVTAATRRIGPEGAADVAEDLVMELGQGRSIAVHEILNEAAKQGLFGTFYARGFAGSASTTDAIVKLRKEMLAGASLKGGGETSEVYTRLSSVMAQLRQGVPLEHAIGQAKRAMVDYAQLTNFERAGMKRLSTYYTFSRNYMPHAWEQLGKSPRALPALIKGIEESNLVTTVNGQVEFKAGDYRVAVQRGAAPVDAIMAIPAIVERLGMVSRGPEDIEPSIGAPAFIGTGGLAGVFGPDDLFALDSRPQKGWFEELLYSTFATKWVTQGLSGELDGEGILDEITKFVAPVRKVDPKHEQRILVNNFTELMNQMKREAEGASPWRKAALESEARKLQVSLSDLLAKEE